MMSSGLTGVRNRVKPPKIGAGMKGMYGDIDHVGTLPTNNPLTGTPAQTTPGQPMRMGATLPGSSLGSMLQKKPSYSLKEKR